MSHSKLVEEARARAGEQTIAVMNVGLHIKGLENNQNLTPIGGVQREVIDLLCKATQDSLQLAQDVNDLASALESAETRAYEAERRCEQSREMAAAYLASHERLAHLRDRLPALRALDEAAGDLTSELSDWALDEAREAWGNTNSGVVKEKRDRLALARTAIAEVVRIVEEPK